MINRSNLIYFRFKRVNWKTLIVWVTVHTSSYLILKKAYNLYPSELTRDTGLFLQPKLQKTSSNFRLA